MTHLTEGNAMPDGCELARLILKIAAERDRQAFARLYQHFAPRVTAFLRKSGLPANTAEEIAQETMLSVWRKASYFDPARAGAATWIFTIARNLRVDHLRRVRVAAAAESAPPEEQEVAPSSEALLLATEQEARVRAALKALSDEQALVLRLSFFGDKAHSEIARELGLPLGTVKSRVRLALGRLRALLEGES
ncbi:RNA polymerase sigma-70 factor (ECF subfamily) [Ancylobacter sp. 3268]|uniref:sigma-70 family RNA polymerase sigma factor n=1 Tax=Ancylobacter sp. 3268 TaxID=2817752 RepID=UPI00285484AA|nr:sigma-70 family RNA polymerase sigma factor [Ancylobacter sp. 3268]MDR6951508.1 RNA polymerase sigma-70 factor (ECF subfamily) [Ancylobacter sp. 3268]